MRFFSRNIKVTPNNRDGNKESFSIWTKIDSIKSGNRDASP